MKKILAILLLCLSAGAFGQHTINYHYNKAGQRIERVVPTIVIPPDTTNQDVSTDIFKEEVNALKFTIYPTPTEGMLTVNVDDLPQTIMTSRISIYNLSGVLLLEQKNVKRTNPIDITNLPTGMYVLVIIINHNTTSFKILKK